MLFHEVLLDFSSFPANWNILNVAVDVNIHAFVGMHHYCTFVTVVSFLPLSFLQSIMLFFYDIFSTWRSPPRIDLFRGL